MKKLNHRGFTIVEALLIFIIIAILIAVGYYVFQRVRDDETDNPLSDSSQIIKDDKAVEKPADSTKFLNITELGVKMPLDQTTSDAYYHIFADRPQYAYLSVESLKNVDQCAADKTTLGVISKNSVTEVDDMSGMTYGDIAKTSGTVIGNTAYTYSSPQASCVEDQASANFAKQTAIIQAFKAAAKKLQAL